MASIVNDFARRLEGRESILVLPEGTEERVLRAARKIRDRHLAQVVLLGTNREVAAAAAASGVSLDDLVVLDPAKSQDLDVYAQQYLELRPGAKPGIARRLVGKPLFFAGSMLRAGRAHAMLAGVSCPTARVIEACLMTVGLVEEIATPSSCFLMLLPQQGGGEKPLIYADCAVNVDPDVAQLADIALASAATGAVLLREPPRVALLSFSSKGSGNHPLARKVAEAASLAARRAPEIAIDGELQLDTAIIERVANIKLNDTGAVAGHANVLVFPDLNAGNIAYKLTQHLAGARALGPLLQGFAHPVADLSRAASVEDIVDTAIVVLAKALPA